MVQAGQYDNYETPLVLKKTGEGIIHEALLNVQIQQQWQSCGFNIYYYLK